MSATQNWSGGRFLEKSGCTDFCLRVWSGQAVLAEEPAIIGSLSYTEGLGHSSTDTHAS